MKKVLFSIALVFMVAIFLTGCEIPEKKITCKLTSNQESSGYVLNTTYTIFYKESIVSKINIQEEIKSDSETILSYFEKYLKEQYDSNKELYGGYTNEVTKKDKTVNTNVTVDFNELNINKYIEDNPAMKSFVDSNNKMKVSGMKTLYESMGATCDN